MKTKVNEIEGELFSGEKAGAEPPSKAKKRGQEVATQSARAVQDGIAPPADPFLAMVREVALRPDLDVGKLNAIMAMQERVLDRNARLAFDIALAEMQPELPVIDRKGRIEVRKKDSHGERTGDVQQATKYAKLEDIIEAITPILSRHKFALRHKVSREGTGVVVTSILSGHGHREEADLMLAPDVGGSKNAVQAVVSSISYAKRTLTCALLNIVSRGDDDDGAAAGDPGPVEVLSAEQLEQVIELAGAVQCPAEDLLAYLNNQKRRPRGHPVVKEVAGLPASRFDDAIAALRIWETNSKAAKK